MLLLLLRSARRVVAAALLLGVVLVGATAARVWWVARQDDPRPSDVIAVLGASQYDGRPSEVLQARLAHARTLYQQHVAPRVVTLGGSMPGDRFTEAQAGSTWLRARGVDQVVALGTGRDTLQSIQALRAEMAAHGWHTAVLVTDPWHSLRARRMAQDLDIDAVTSPTRSGPSVHTRGTEVRYVLRETAGYLYYRLFGAGTGTERGPSAV